MADYDNETLRLLKASTKTTDALSERIASMSPLENRSHAWAKRTP